MPASSAHPASPAPCRGTTIEAVDRELARCAGQWRYTAGPARGASLVRAPLRLDLGMAGPADCFPYCAVAAASSINASVLIDGVPPITASVHPGTGDHPVWSLGDAKVTAASLADLKGPLPEMEAVARTLATRVLLLPSADDLIALLGGRPAIALASTLPHGTGLGASSALWGSLVLALGRALNVELDYKTVHLVVLRSELELGAAGGWEDLTCLLGGWKLAASTPAQSLVPAVEHLCPSPAARDGLVRCLHLLWTGRARGSRAPFARLIHQLLEGVASVWSSVARFAAINSRLAAALVGGDTAYIREALALQWAAWTALTGDGTCTSSEQAFVAAVGELGGAARFAGAGDGGCMLVWSPENAHAAVEQLARSCLPHSRWLSWQLAQGVFVS